MEMTNYQPTDEVRRIRARLDHPIIDSDGHLIEFLPLVRDLLVDLAGKSLESTPSLTAVRRSRD